MRALGLLQAVDSGDVRMVERGKDFGFSLESSQPLRILGELVREHLDGYIPTEFPISCPKHLPHPTFADRLEDLVVSEFVTRLERHDPPMLRR